MFLLLLLFLFYISKSSYIVLSIHRYKCREENLVSQWVFPNPSECMVMPFWDVVKYSYNKTLDKIVYSTYKKNEDCDGDYNKTVSYFDLNNCTMKNRFNWDWYINFTVAEEKPFNLSKSLDWWVQENYIDSECEQLWDSVISAGSSRMSVMSRLTGKNKDIEIYTSTEIYCQKTWMVEEHFLTSQKDKVIAWKYLPNVTDDQCLEKYNDTLFPTYAFIDSIKKKCLTQAEFESQMMTLVPKKSKSKYLLSSYYFEPTCEYGKNHTVLVQRLDDCFLDYYSLIFEQEEFFELHFENTGCQGRIYRLDIGKDTEKYKYIDTCSDSGVEDEQNIEWYKEITFSDDPYFPNMMSMLTTTTPCDQTLSIEEKKNAEALMYTNPEHCLDTVMLNAKYPETFNFKSFRGECRKGKLYLKNFTQTHECYGYVQYETSDDFCFEGNQALGFYHHTTCIPRICGEFSEYDLDVCNGRGECGEGNICECNYGYLGEMCESYGCNGIEKNEEEKVCSGHGKCVDMDDCDCTFGFTGEYCNSQAYIAVILVPIIWQNTKMGKFKKLKNFDLLLKEQLIEEDQSIAHLSINKNLFKVNYSDIQLISVLGEGGSNSIVYKAEWHGKFCGFKCFKTRTVCNNEDSFREFETEVSIISSIHHPQILQFFGALLDPPRVGILMEYCENGDLVRFIKDFRMVNEKMYPLDEKIRMIEEMSSAMEYLSQRSVIHRDLKNENILVDIRESTKLSDFGLSKIVDRMSRPKTRYIGTTFFIAPEVILKGSYDTKCDVFSFSMLVFVLVTENYHPFKGHSSHNIEIQIAQDENLRPNILEFEKIVGKEHDWLVNIVVSGWNHLPSERMSFENISKILKKKLRNVTPM